MRARLKTEPGVKPATPRPDERLSVAVVRDAEGFAALEAEWDALYEACPTATPFQSWAWLYSWWEHYGGTHELRLVTMRDGAGTLVGLLPLMLERSRGFGRLLFVGQDLTDLLDVLAAEGREEDVAEASAEALREMGGWQVADLQELRPGALAWALQDRWTGPKVGLRQSVCPVTEVRPWDELLKSLTPKRRGSARRAVRYAERDGVRAVLVEAEEEAEAAAGRLVALHRASWRGRGIGLEHTTPRFEAYIKAAVRRITARGLGAVSEFRLDGEAIVAHFLVFGHDFVGGYMLGANEEALKKYQFSSLCVWDAMNVARSKDLRYMNDLRGAESYKVRWSSELVPNHRLLLGRNAVVLEAYSRWQVWRSKALAYAGSEEAPRWIKEAVARYRALRSRLARYAGRSG